MVVVSHPGHSLLAGTTVSITCIVTLSAAVDSEVSMNVIWLNGSTPISNDTDRISISLLSGQKPNYTSILAVSPLSDVDNANYTCQASASSENNFILASEVGKSSANIHVEQISRLNVIINVHLITFC